MKLASSILIPAFSVAMILARAGEVADANGYSHGTASCLQGKDGPGLRLRLRHTRKCDGTASPPYLEIDVREQPIAVNQKIVIGDSNSAFRCRGERSSCEASLWGQAMFNHLEEASGKGLRTDGWYQLKFSTGLEEAGRFTVDCIEPCG